MHIPVHSPWLPPYINVMQTIIIILAMAGLFPDRPHCISSFLQPFILDEEKWALMALAVGR